MGVGEDRDRYFDNELCIALIRRPAFPAMVRVIVVEMANPVHQALLDRFILDGAPMSRDELAPSWRDASNPEVWESPLYAALLRAIQDVNPRRPRDQRVRVIGGDSRLDWKIKLRQQGRPESSHYAPTSNDRRIVGAAIRANTPPLWSAHRTSQLATACHPAV